MTFYLTISNTHTGGMTSMGICIMDFSKMTEACLKMKLSNFSCGRDTPPAPSPYCTQKLQASFTCPMTHPLNFKNMNAIGWIETSFFWQICFFFRLTAMENLLQKYPFSRIRTPHPKKNPGYGPAKKCCQSMAQQLLALEHYF